MILGLENNIKGLSRVFCLYMEVFISKCAIKMEDIIFIIRISRLFSLENKSGKPMIESKKKVELSTSKFTV